MARKSRSKGASGFGSGVTAPPPAAPASSNEESNVSSTTASATTKKGGGSGHSSAAGAASNRSPPVSPPSSPRKRTSASAKSSGSSSLSASASSSPSVQVVEQRSWGSRLWREVRGPILVLACMGVGAAFGFAVGSGWGWEAPEHRPLWKQALANRIRSTATYQLMTFQGPVWEDWITRFAEWAEEVERDLEADEYVQNPSHPRIFATLREAVVREEGGYVHPDLGFMVPAPCGAARGIGMVRGSYHKCQVNCLPGTADEKRQFEKEQDEALLNNTTIPLFPYPNFHQEEVLIRVPLNFQMTRTTALDTLLGLIPASVQKSASLHELDDSVLLVMALAHERGVGRYSRWVPYVASLPPQPSCGYSIEVRPHILDAVAAYDELGTDVQGWPHELVRATSYADKIAESLDDVYGEYLSTPKDVSSLDNIKWALCHVASRAIAGSDKLGALRLIPVVDLINHDFHASAYIELTGKERLNKGDFVEASEEQSGTFVIRSMRHGRLKPLRKGQELMVNYNVPTYSPLDWLVSMGFVPPERQGRWQKLEPVLPRVRSDGPFASREKQHERSEEAHNPLKEREAEVLEYLRSLDN